MTFLIRHDFEVPGGKFLKTGSPVTQVSKSTEWRVRMPLPVEKITHLSPSRIGVEGSWKRVAWADGAATAGRKKAARKRKFPQLLGLTS